MSAKSPNPPPRPWAQVFQARVEDGPLGRLRVEGEIPAGLRGTLYRNGPGRLEAFGKRVPHWFDADGTVSAVRFQAGEATGALQTITSEKTLREERAGKFLYSGYGTASRGLPSLNPATKVRNAANTNVIAWQGRLFALYEASLPTELDAESLALLGETDLDGCVLQSFSAHPHAVESHGVIYNFGVRHGRKTELDLYALGPTGEAKLLATHTLGWPSMVHDFIVTERHFVFFVPPLKLRLLRMFLGWGSFSDNLQWRGALGTEVLVIPIDRPQEITRFEVDPFYQWHFANAFERGEEIVVDFVRYPNFDSNSWIGDIFQGEINAPLESAFCRGVVHPGRRSLDVEVLWDRPCEFPRISPLVEGKDARFAAISAHASVEATRHELQQRIALIDLHHGEVEEVAFGEAHYPSEPIFAPAPDAEHELDGWLLTQVFDAEKNRTYVAILDPERLSEGPVARVHYDRPLPYSLHGSFVG